MHTRLREERRRRGWTQARLARTLHVSHTSVSHYEVGFSRPRPATADALEDIFGIPAGDLLSAAADSSPKKPAAAGASKEDHDARQGD